MQASLNQPITIWKTAFNQKRPYLGLDDLSNAITHIIKKNIFNNQIYNIVSNNYKVSDIVKYINLFKKVKIKYVYHPIMNQLSYSVMNKKFTDTNFKFNSNIKKEIQKTLKRLKNLDN